FTRSYLIFREAEAAISETSVDFILWCNRRVEGNLWRCTATVTVHTSGVNDPDGANHKVVNIFHKNNRSTTFSTPKFDSNNIEIRFELQDISGYRSRDPAIFEMDFSKPSEMANVCIAFENTEKRLYVNKEYLSIHSRVFANLLANRDVGRVVSPYFSTENSECGDDFDVLNVGAALLDRTLEEEDERADFAHFYSHGMLAYVATEPS
ncbi:unnamed protein product, partial [Strongylus vulgaris]